MADSDKYLQPGTLEEYCLGLLPEEEARAVAQAISQSPELQQQVQETEAMLMKMSEKKGSPELKNKILQALKQTPAPAAINLADPPLISRFSDIDAWNAALAGVTPDTSVDAMKVYFIKDSPDLQLCLAWLYDSLDENEHQADEFAESFLILEGSCECNIGGQMIRLQAGDYLDIPSDTHHTIRATTPGGAPVKAIIQRRKIAA